MASYSASGRERREVPSWARKGMHVTVSDGNRRSFKGIVEEELPSAIYVRHRITGKRIGTFSLASVDSQLPGTLAQRGYRGPYGLFATLKVESMPDGDGDAPFRPDIAEAIRKVLRNLEARMTIEELVDSHESHTEIERELRRVLAE